MSPVQWDVAVEHRKRSGNEANAVCKSKTSVLFLFEQIPMTFGFGCSLFFFVVSVAYYYSLVFLRGDVAVVRAPPRNTENKPIPSTRTQNGFCIITPPITHLGRHLYKHEQQHSNRFVAIQNIEIIRTRNVLFVLFAALARVLLGFYWVYLGTVLSLRLNDLSTMNFKFNDEFQRAISTGFPLLGFYQVLLGFTGFYWVLLSFTGFYWVLLGFTGFYWVFLEIVLCL